MAAISHLQPEPKAVRNPLWALLSFSSPAGTWRQNERHVWEGQRRGLSTVRTIKFSSPCRSSGLSNSAELSCFSSLVTIKWDYLRAYSVLAGNCVSDTYWGIKCMWWSIESTDSFRAVNRASLNHGTSSSLVTPWVSFIVKVTAQLVKMPSHSRIPITSSGCCGEMHMTPCQMLDSVHWDTTEEM